MSMGLAPLRHGYSPSPLTHVFSVSDYHFWAAGSEPSTFGLYSAVASWCLLHRACVLSPTTRPGSGVSKVAINSGSMDSYATAPQRIRFKAGKRRAMTGVFLDAQPASLSAVYTIKADAGS